MAEPFWSNKKINQTFQSYKSDEREMVVIESARYDS